MSSVMTSQSTASSTNLSEETLMNSLYETMTCPITGDIMKEPVSGNDGSTYERSAIVEWLNRKSISPTTNQPMNISELKVNANIRYLCDKYHAGQLGNKKVEKSAPTISNNHINLKHNTNLLLSRSGNENNIISMLNFSIDTSTFPETDTGYLPQDIVLVIDRSGSMGANVEAKDGDGNKLEHGFSVQDIVNHAASTVVKTLDKNSRISVITFDNEIEVNLVLTNMTELNKSNILGIIKTIKPRGQTNIYGAVEKAIEILDERTDKSRNGSIILFTDGSPNIEPARGTAPTIKRLRAKKNFTSSIHTMGFGYGLREGLLYDIAKSSNGCNGHIPDGGLIATVFCNLLGNILCTVVLNLQLHFITPNIELVGDFEYNYNSELGTTIYDLGTVQLGQERNIILDLNHYKNHQNMEIKYYYTYKIGGISYTSEPHKIDVVLHNINPIKQDNQDKDSVTVSEELLRCKLVENIREMSTYNSIENYEKSKEIYEKFKGELLELYEWNKSNLVTGMKKNLIEGQNEEGQIYKAVTNPVYFRRWGKFYLDQLSRALLLQVKPNFKDPACVFGGELFMDLVDMASDTFDSLPPPTPSNTPIVNTGYGGGSTYRSMSSVPAGNQPTATVNMSQFNTQDGGCYLGSSLITMANGLTKPVNTIKKNDVILTSETDDINSKLVFTKVLCVVKTSYKDGVILVNVGDLEITPYHPVIYENKWQFPVDCGVTYRSTEKDVYTLVLENNHIAIVDGIPTICLGHNYQSNKVLKHPYFGSKKVINDLMKIQNFSEGFIEINPEKYIRDDNFVIGYMSENQEVEMEID